MCTTRLKFSGIKSAKRIHTKAHVVVAVDLLKLSLLKTR